MKDEKKTYEYFFAKEVSQSYSYVDALNIRFENAVSEQFCLFKKIGEHQYINVITEEILTDEISEKTVSTEEFYAHALETPYAITSLEKVYEGNYYLGLHTNLIADLDNRNNLESEKQNKAQKRARIKNIFKRRK